MQPPGPNGFGSRSSFAASWPCANGLAARSPSFGTGRLETPTRMPRFRAVPRRASSRLFGTGGERRRADPADELCPTANWLRSRLGSEKGDAAVCGRVVPVETEGGRQKPAMTFPRGPGPAVVGGPDPDYRWIVQRWISLTCAPNEIRSLRNAGSSCPVLHK